MKRGAIGFAGFGAGLIWVWLCLYVLGHVDWASPSKARHSCIDAGDCSWPGIAVAIAYVFTPPVLFAILSAAAWQRWPAWKWAGRVMGLGFITAAFYAAMAIMSRES
jgi:hypothetical protein